MGAIGTIGKDSKIMTAIENFNLSKETLNFIVNRTIKICIRKTYYIFCMCNKEWENPELLNWWKLIQTSWVISPTTESITVRVDKKLQILLITNKKHLKLRLLLLLLLLLALLLYLSEVQLQVSPSSCYMSVNVKL